MDPWSDDDDGDVAFKSQKSLPFSMNGSQDLFSGNFSSNDESLLDDQALGKHSPADQRSSGSIKVSGINTTWISPLRTNSTLNRTQNAKQPEKEKKLTAITGKDNRKGFSQKKSSGQSNTSVVWSQDFPDSVDDFLDSLSPDKTQHSEELPKFSFLMNKSDNCDKFLSPPVKTRTPVQCNRTPGQSVIKTPLQSRRTPVLSKTVTSDESPLVRTGSVGKRLGGRFMYPNQMTSPASTVRSVVSTDSALDMNMEVIKPPSKADNIKSSAMSTQSQRKPNKMSQMSNRSKIGDKSELDIDVNALQSMGSSLDDATLLTTDLGSDVTDMSSILPKEQIRDREAIKSKTPVKQSQKTVISDTDIEAGESTQGADSLAMSPSFRALMEELDGEVKSKAELQEIGEELDRLPSLGDPFSGMSGWSADDEKHTHSDDDMSSVKSKKESSAASNKKNLVKSAASQVSTESLKTQRRTIRSRNIIDSDSDVSSLSKSPRSQGDGKSQAVGASVPKLTMKRLPMTKRNKPISPAKSELSSHSADFNDTVQDLINSSDEEEMQTAGVIRRQDRRGLEVSPSQKCIERAGDVVPSNSQGSAQVKRQKHQSKALHNNDISQASGDDRHFVSLTESSEDNDLEKRLVSHTRNAQTPKEDVTPTKHKDDMENPGSSTMRREKEKKRPSSEEEQKREKLSKTPDPKTPIKTRTASSDATKRKITEDSAEKHMSADNVSEKRRSNTEKMSSLIPSHTVIGTPASEESVVEATSQTPSRRRSSRISQLQSSANKTKEKHQAEEQTAIAFKKAQQKMRDHKKLHDSKSTSDDRIKELLLEDGDYELVELLEKEEPEKPPPSEEHLKEQRRVECKVLELFDFLEKSSSAVELTSDQTRKKSRRVSYGGISQSAKRKSASQSTTPKRPETQEFKRKVKRTPLRSENASKEKQPLSATTETKTRRKTKVTPLRSPPEADQDREEKVSELDDTHESKSATPVNQMTRGGEKRKSAESYCPPKRRKRSSLPADVVGLFDYKSAADRTKQTDDVEKAEADRERKNLRKRKSKETVSEMKVTEEVKHTSAEDVESSHEDSFEEPETRKAIKKTPIWLAKFSVPRDKTSRSKELKTDSHQETQQTTAEAIVNLFAKSYSHKHHNHTESTTQARKDKSQHKQPQPSTSTSVTMETNQDHTDRNLPDTSVYDFIPSQSSPKKGKQQKTSRSKQPKRESTRNSKGRKAVAQQKQKQERIKELNKVWGITAEDPDATPDPPLPSQTTQLRDHINEIDENTTLVVDNSKTQTRQGRALRHCRFKSLSSSDADEQKVAKVSVSSDELQNEAFDSSAADCSREEVESADEEVIIKRVVGPDDLSDSKIQVSSRKGRKCPRKQSPRVKSNEEPTPDEQPSTLSCDSDLPIPVRGRRNLRSVLDSTDSSQYITDQSDQSAIDTTGADESLLKEKNVSPSPLIRNRRRSIKAVLSSESETSIAPAASVSSHVSPRPKKKSPQRVGISQEPSKDHALKSPLAKPVSSKKSQVPNGNTSTRIEKPLIKAGTRQTRNTQVEEQLVFTHTSLSKEQKKKVEDCAKILDARVVQQYEPAVTHVITSVDADSQCPRTMKYMRAVLDAKWVVSSMWTDICLEYGKHVSEEAFEVQGSTPAPNSLASLRSRMDKADQKPSLFAGCQFYLQGEFKPPSPPKDQLVQLIESGDGQVIHKIPKQAPNSKPYHASGTKLNDTGVFCLSVSQSSGLPQWMVHVSPSWIVNCVAHYKLLDPAV